MESLPSHIVVTCQKCGHQNVFRQPYPYHAGQAGQGFLYSSTGDRTLVWSMFDPEYVKVAGQKPPWALDAAEREHLEERLLPAPGGNRWSFQNPARCLACAEPISGGVTETPYYLHYEGSLDRDISRGGSPGLKDMLRPKRPKVPWTSRDVWLGVAAMAVIIAAAWGVILLLGSLSTKPNIDLWTALVPTLFELLFLVPVWWFTRHKYKASPRELGYRKFAPIMLLIGFGLLIAFYFFNVYYAAALAQYGLEVQTDVTPFLRRLATPWPLVFSVTIVAPFAEETFFRGFVFNGLRSRMAWPWAAAISAALFAGAHLELTFFIPAFILGFLFAYLYQRSDSIWPGMIFHCLLNAVAMTVALLSI